MTTENDFLECVGCGRWVNVSFVHVCGKTPRPKEGLELFA